VAWRTKGTLRHILTRFARSGNPRASLLARGSSSNLRQAVKKASPANISAFESSSTVVIECKIGNSRVSTHDALTYSAKAATHKHVHPFLRYGILLADFKNSLPSRLIRHGAYFDFMVALQTEFPSRYEQGAIDELILAEIIASQNLQLLFKQKKAEKHKFVILHKQLMLK